MGTNIAGYAYGSVASSPVSVKDLDLLKKTVLFDDADVANLRRMGTILESRIDALLDVWYGFVGGNDHLLHYFTSGGVPNGDYLQAVRVRFGQWVRDTCNRSYDQEWLDYQYEVALRHHRAKKNITDGVNSVPIIHYRYIVAFIVPLTLTVRPFLVEGGVNDGDIDGMMASWLKALTLTTILWTYPYVKEGDF